MPATRTLRGGRVLPYDNQPAAMALADFDGDGELDIVATANGGTTTIYPGNGDGTLSPFSFRIAAGGSYLAVGDFNDDGKVDVVVSSHTSQRIEVLLGD